MASVDKKIIVKYVNLFDIIPDNKCNLCLVVEVPMVTYEDSCRFAPSPDIGINIVCWKYVSDLHVVMPNV
jgi:hypothetical protein